MRNLKILAHLLPEKSDTDDEFGLSRKLFQDMGNDCFPIDWKQRFVQLLAEGAHARALASGKHTNHGARFQDPCSFPMRPSGRLLSSCTRTTSSKCGVDVSYSRMSVTASNLCSVEGTTSTVV